MVNVTLEALAAVVSLALLIGVWIGEPVGFRRGMARRIQEARAAITAARAARLLQDAITASHGEQVWIPIEAARAMAEDLRRAVGPARATAGGGKQ